MGDNTGIQWTDATWNPTTGCTRVSPGCDRCYAFQLHDQRHVAWKRGKLPNAAPQYHKPFSDVQLLPDRLDAPKHWKWPRKIFVDSMADLFHEAVPFEFIARVFVVMHEARQHTYQILTKRPERMREFVAWYRRDYGGHVRYGSTWPADYGHVWLGVSVEDQQRAEERIPLLLATPAAVRFISAEPLLGPLDLAPYLYCCPSCGGPRSDRHADACGYCEHTPQTQGLGWVIAGGESGGPPERALVRRCGNCGSGAPASQCFYCQGRPWQPKPEALGWVRALRDQCAQADVAFFWKQWGGPLPTSGGSELDGRTWDEFPFAAVSA